MDVPTPEGTHFMAALAGAAGGSGTIGLLARFLIQNWIKGHDQRADKFGDAMQSVAVELGKLSVIVESFGKSLDKVVTKLDAKGEAVAVLQSEMETVKTNLNNLGAKVRSIRP